jgi:hypothetical protein
MLIDRIQGFQGQIGLVMLDHLGQTLGQVDENSPLVASVMGSLRGVCEYCGVSILLIHHQVKGGRKDGFTEDSVRGHSSILASLDSAILVRRDQNIVEVKPIAIRGPDVPTVSAQFAFERDQNTLALTSACFWSVERETVADRVRQAIIDVLREAQEEVNQTMLRSLVKSRVGDVGDSAIRSEISRLEAEHKIVCREGAKGAKLYKAGG